ncbi:MAG: DUF2892 domain-containing protein, partial [Cytophagales bacterium]|nr:DUF2892 domain-containing protein [Cytophaga sp.]
MICNMGSLDKVIRRSLGLIIIGLGFYFENPIGLIGILTIAMTYLNYCPIYVPFKI